MTTPLTPEQCAHVVVTTYGDGESGPRLWACADCSLRFYPACSVCVDVGHRNIDHPLAARETQPDSRLREALERLARAFKSEDELRHGEAVKGSENTYVGLGVCAYDDDIWPCRTERLQAPLRQLIQSALAASPAEDLGSEYGRLLAERDRLIAEGADPADLDVPTEPADRAPETP